MGLVDSLFGMAGSKSKPIQLPTFSKAQQGLFDQLAGTVKKQLKTGPTTTAPPMSVPATPEEQSYLTWAKSDALQKMMSGELPYNVGPEYAEQYFEQAIRPIYQREYEENLLPQIQENYAGPRFHGSARTEALSDAARNYAMDLASKKAELIYGEELARRNALESAMGRVLPAGEAMGSAGAYSRMVEEQKVMEDLQRYFMGEDVGTGANPLYNPAMAWAFNLLGLQPFTYGEQTDAQGEGLFPGMLKGASQGFLSTYFK